MSTPASLPFREEHRPSPVLAPLARVTTTKSFRWRQRLGHDEVAITAAALSVALLLVGFLLARHPSGQLVAVLTGLSILVLVARATHLFPRNAERLDRLAEARRLQEDEAYVSKYWLNRSNRTVLRDFLAAFDRAQFSLHDAIVAEMGPFGEAMPLHQQLAYAAEAGVWSTAEVELWDQCLAIRQQVLVSRRTELRAGSLTKLTDRLDILSLKTARSVDT